MIHGRLEILGLNIYSIYVYGASLFLSQGLHFVLRMYSFFWILFPQCIYSFSFEFYIQIVWYIYIYWVCISTDKEHIGTGGCWSAWNMAQLQAWYRELLPYSTPDHARYVSHSFTHATRLLYITALAFHLLKLSIATGNKIH